MDCGAILAPTARPKRIARSTAALFITGSTPGSARSTGLACVFGSAPNLIGEPLKIFDSVVSCTWFSRPMTTSHSILVFSLRYSLMYRAGDALNAKRRPLVPVGRQLVLVGDVEQLGFAEVVADDLQSDRAIRVLVALAEAARNRHAGQAGQAGRQREDIGGSSPPGRRSCRRGPRPRSGRSAPLRNPVRSGGGSFAPSGSRRRNSRGTAHRCRP